MADLVYTDRDYDTIYARLVAAIEADPVLRASIDLQGGSPDRLFLVALATQGDRLSYLLNTAANETFLVRARQRESVIDAARGLGYELATAQPASTSLTFTVRRQPPEGWTLAAGQQVQSVDGAVTFEVAAARAVLAGETSFTARAIEGRTLAERFVGATAAAAPAGQRVTLGRYPVIVAEGAAGRFEVVVDGVAWTRVDHFLDSGSYARHFRVERDADDRATVVFGDGAQGVRPAAGADIVVTYRVGGGTRGNVRRGRLTRLVGTLRTPSGVAVDVAVTNASDVDSGADRETIAHARYAAPASLRATSRTIAREDFALHAEEVPGILRALCQTRTQDASIGAFVHRVYVLSGARRTVGDETSPMVAAAADADLRAAVERRLTVDRPAPDVDTVVVGAATLRAQAVSATLYLEPGTSETDTSEAAQLALARLFDPTVRENGAWRIDFGRCVPRSRIIAALQAIPGVRRVVLSVPSSDPAFAATEFPVLDGEPTLALLVEA